MFRENFEEGLRSVKGRRLLFLASLLLTAFMAIPTAADWPAWMEKLLWNPEERTARAVDAAEDGTVPLEPLETALRLVPEDPVAQYNAGTARIQAGGDAEAPLTQAAEAGEGDLVPSAHYNLGNARLKAQDFEGAIESYKNALRHASNFEDAKWNLELARRLLEQQQQQEQDQQQNQDEQGEQDEQEDQDQQDQEQQQDGEQEQQDQDQNQDQQEQQQGGDEEQQQDQQQGEQPPEGTPQDQQQQEQSPLPQFSDLPDMTAEEAAAILEAIENMERERRQKEAEERARVTVRGKKDW